MTLNTPTLPGSANRRRVAHGIVVVALLTACATSAFAQFERRRPIKVAEPNFSIGLFGGLNTNIHTGDFAANRSVYVCEKFTNGAGAGIAGGVEMLYNFDRNYGTMLRLGYGSKYAAFLSERGQVALFDSSGIYEREHVWRPTLTYATAELLFNFNPISRRVEFFLGPTVSMNLGKSFTQEEHIVTVSGTSYTFPNGTNTWIVDQGDVVGLRKVVIGAEIGVAVEFRLARELLFAPSAWAQYFLQSPSTSLQWSVLSFQLGASLRYVASFDE